MIIVGRVSDGKLLDSFKTQSSATSPPSNNDNISLQSYKYHHTNYANSAHNNKVAHMSHSRDSKRIGCCRQTVTMSLISILVIHYQSKFIVKSKKI